MKQLHYNCDGEVEPIIGFEGCYDDNYGYCMKCGLEGELIVKDTNKIKSLIYIWIEPITPRYEPDTSDPLDGSH